MVPRGRRPPGRLSLPRTARKLCRRLSRFPGAASLGERSERLKAAPGTFHHAPVKANPHAVADCPPAGEQGPDGRQVNPAAGGSAGTEGRRTCPPAPLVPLTGGQDFLARPRARPRDSDSAPRGLLMDLSWTCRRPAVDRTPWRRARGARVTLRWRGSRSRGDRPRIPTLLYVLQQQD